MALEFDGLVVFRGHEAVPGLCHLRVYRRAGGRLIAIVGELSRSPGPPPSPVIECVAEAIRETVTHDQPFELISHHHQGDPQFLQVLFSADPKRRTDLGGTFVVGAHVDELAARSPSPAGAFRDPRWTPIRDIDAHVGEPVEVWAREDYTAANLFGEAGRRLADRVADEAAARGLDFQARLGEFT